MDLIIEKKAEEFADALLQKKVQNSFTRFFRWRKVFTYCDMAMAFEEGAKWALKQDINKDLMKQKDFIIEINKDLKQRLDAMHTENDYLREKLTELRANNETR